MVLDFKIDVKAFKWENFYDIQSFQSQQHIYFFTCKFVITSFWNDKIIIILVRTIMRNYCCCFFKIVDSLFCFMSSILGHISDSQNLIISNTLAVYWIHMQQTQSFVTTWCSHFIHIAISSWKSSIVLVHCIDSQNDP